MSVLFPEIVTPSRSGEIIVDSFAGGGGASTGFFLALGRHPDVAVNHDPEAVAMHTANHPTTEHFCQNVWQVDPSEVAKRGPIGAAWFSPDCKHFSKDKGGKPREKNVRDLAWIVVAYAKLPRHLRPRVIFLENVEEFQTWGGLLPDGQPDPARKGDTFRQWLGELRRLGYSVQWKELRACDFGAPTIRKRLFLIARCDGDRIVWPEPTHGPGRPLPYRTAADIIDWSIPCPSIFERVRPLADATMRRIATGTMRYVVNAAAPFIVTCNHGGEGFRGQALGEPFRTVTAAHDAHGLVVPVLTGCGGRAAQSPPRSCDKPMGTITAKADQILVATHVTKFQENSTGFLPDEPMHTVMAGAPRFGVVAAFLAKHYSGVVGHGVEQPIGTVTTADHHSVVAAHLTHFYSSAADGGNGDLNDPIKTVTASGQHAGLVTAFLTKYYGQGGQDQDCRAPLHTIPTVDRFGLVTVMVAGKPFILSDIGMRMLTPRELFRAQGFPDGYIIEIERNGKMLSKAAQVRMCGNSVCPPMAAALIRANVPDLSLLSEAAE